MLTADGNPSEPSSNQILGGTSTNLIRSGKVCGAAQLSPRRAIRKLDSGQCEKLDPCDSKNKTIIFTDPMKLLLIPCYLIHHDTLQYEIVCLPYYIMYYYTIFLVLQDPWNVRYRALPELIDNFPSSDKLRHRFPPPP